VKAAMACRYVCQHAKADAWLQAVFSNKSSVRSIFNLSATTG